MKYDLATIQCKCGSCDNCGMRGILFRKVIIKPNEVGEAPTLEDLPVLDVCITCFETPTGVKSENLRHERLPEAEYK